MDVQESYMAAGAGLPEGVPRFVLLECIHLACDRIFEVLPNPEGTGDEMEDWKSWRPIAMQIGWGKRRRNFFKRIYNLLPVSDGD